jgi:hypothetical protein
MLEKKNILLPKGETLEVEFSHEFSEIIKEHFCLSSKEEISDDHVRMYIWGAFKNALDKAEKEKT